MKAIRGYERFILILIGVVLTVGCLVLTGVASAPQIGRYQMEAIQRGDFSDVYVIDTTTGAIKYVDFKDQSLPFEEIKVKKGLFN